MSVRTVALFALSVCALSAASQDEFKRDCAAFKSGPGFGTFKSCAADFFTLNPVHPTVKSIVPGGGRASARACRSNFRAETGGGNSRPTARFRSANTGWPRALSRFRTRLSGNRIARASRSGLNFTSAPESCLSCHSMALARIQRRRGLPTSVNAGQPSGPGF